MYTVYADDAVCCIPTGKFLFLLLFGHIPHYLNGLSKFLTTCVQYILAMAVGTV